MRKFYLMAVTGVVSALAVAGNAMAAADPNVTSTADTIKTYFTDNLPIVIGVFVAIVGTLWVLALLTRSAGFKNRGKVG
jgi:hypothetical protein